MLSIHSFCCNKLIFCILICIRHCLFKHFSSHIANIYLSCFTPTFHLICYQYIGAIYIISYNIGSGYTSYYLTNMYSYTEIQMNFRGNIVVYVILANYIGHPKPKLYSIDELPTYVSFLSFRLIIAHDYITITNSVYFIYFKLKAKLIKALEKFT